VTGVGLAPPPPGGRATGCAGRVVDVVLVDVVDDDVVDDDVVVDDGELGLTLAGPAG
jgi:hypothetical protein